MVEVAPEITTVDILRHGACADGDRLRGRTDSPLSATGRDQMTRALNGLSGWQRIVTSPLTRCRSFAEDFAERHHLPLSIKADWREVDFGIWDGLSPAEIYHREPEGIDRYYRQPGSFTPEGGEPLNQASKRVVNAWENLVDEFSGEHLLLICHGGVMRLLFAALQNAPLSATHFFDIPCGTLTRFRVYRGDAGNFIRLVFHGNSEGAP